MNLKLKICLVSVFLLQSILVFGKSYNVKDYGAKGDGKTDDYFALLKVADLINADGGGEVIFPQGNYYIGQYHDGKNNLRDITFFKCNNLTIKGNNATITLKGDFHRKADGKAGKYTTSSVMCIRPLYIRQCTGVLIEGLEVDGNVEQMTRDNVIEGSGYLILIQSSKNVTLKDLNLHHAPTDALFIDGVTNSPSENIKAYNVICSNNARQGMSIGALENGYFENCQFINTGYGLGKFSSYMPSAGVDIEPRTFVKNVRFLKCTFKNNRQTQFVVTGTRTTNNVILDDCIVDAGSSTAPYQVIIGAKNVIIQNSIINCGAGNIYPSWPVQPVVIASLYNNTIRSSYRGIVITKNDTKDQVVIENNTIEYTGNRRVPDYFPYIQSNITFKNNNIKIPEQFLKVSGPTALIQKARHVSGNRFFSGSKQIKPNVSYQGATIVGDK